MVDDLPAAAEFSRVFDRRRSSRLRSRATASNTARKSSSPVGMTCLGACAPFGKVAEIHQTQMPALSVSASWASRSAHPSRDSARIPSPFPGTRAGDVQPLQPPTTVGITARVAFGAATARGVFDNLSTGLPNADASTDVILHRMTPRQFLAVLLFLGFGRVRDHAGFMHVVLGAAT